MTTPEERAREKIAAKLAVSAWIVQSRNEITLYSGLGVVEIKPEGLSRIYSQMRLSCIAPCGLNAVQLSDEKERQGSSGYPPGLSPQHCW